jgi:hypothetical protein
MQEVKAGFSLFYGWNVRVTFSVLLLNTENVCMLHIIIVMPCLLTLSS